VTDLYDSFAELEAREVEGRDWSREYRPRSSPVLVMAPHGGWIEPFTTELAEAIAGHDLSFYTFCGLKSGGNKDLHLTSHRFDEPMALKAMAEADTVLAVHGERTRDRSFVMVGGGDMELRARLEQGLREAGFTVAPPRSRLEGQNPKNICNRGREGGGGQLELSEGLRRSLRHDPQLLEAFVSVVRDAVLAGRARPASERGRGLQPPGWDSRPL
jgi:phage replication-related protein YjqB (UPF0714/DUF867 family)